MQRLGVLLGALFLVACPKPDPVGFDAGLEAGSSAGAADAGGLDASAEVDGGPSVDAGLPRFAIALTISVDAGLAAVPLVDDRAELDVTGVLIVEIPLQLRDYRIRLFDDREQVVPSDDLASIGDAGILYEIALLQPLKPGRPYTLVVDAETGSEVLDQAGRAWDDARVNLKVRGEPQPDEKKKSPARKRRK